MGFEIGQSAHPRIVKSGQTARDVPDPIDAYFNAAKDHELLTPEAEVELGFQIQAGLAIAGNLELPEDFDGTEGARQQAEETLDSARSARETMIMSNLRLVSLVANKFTWSSMGYDELLHEGVIGLMRAADKFDPERGIKFSTYATWWVRQAIGLGIATQARMIRLSKDTEFQLSNVKKLQRENPERPLADICKELGLNEARMAHALFITQPVISLDTPLDGAADQDDYGETFGSKFGADYSLATLHDAMSAQAYDLESIRVMRNLSQALEPQFGTSTQQIAYIIKSTILDGIKINELSKELGMSVGAVSAIKGNGLTYLRQLGEHTVRALVDPQEELEKAS
jgi:RNA polymerase sigma factor (sigma-70 family)